MLHVATTVAASLGLAATILGAIAWTALAIRSAPASATTAALTAIATPATTVSVFVVGARHDTWAAVAGYDGRVVFDIIIVVIDDSGGG